MLTVSTLLDWKVAVFPPVAVPEMTTCTVTVVFSREAAA